ncbi:MAG: hypothetical protein M1522_00280, partial [Actinobacteria bacterium]|nr:hypothetical protein [Actinomycetota bacterium]
ERSTGAGPAEWAVWLQLRRKELGMSREDLAEAVACAPVLVRDWEEGREGRGGASEYVLPPPLYRKRLAKILGYPESSRSEGAAAGGHQAWDGWGTGLKPGWEMILVARKPLVGTVADGAKPFGRVAGRPYSRHVSYGRWPSNLVFSHHVDCVRLADSRLVGSSTSRTVERWACVPDCAVRRLDDQAETRASDRIEGLSLAGRGCNDIFGLSTDLPVLADRGEAAVEDSAAASRFFPIFPVEGEAMFYAGKAAAAERPVGPDGTKHATVKPLALVRWLVRLVTPPGGTVLDPFMGSGSLAEAAALESVRWVGIEICDGTDGKPDYVALIEERMKRFDRGESPGAPAWMRQEAAGQASLFGAAS